MQNIILHNSIYNIITIIVTAVGFFVLFRRKVLLSDSWRATVTPLASIIGSGFLISAPLIVEISGMFAPFVMLVIVCIAYGIGNSIRYNIAYIEPLLKLKKATRWLSLLDKISRPSLGLAYLISVAFYLKLFSAFAFHGLGLYSTLSENILTTVILLFIGITGKLKGLSMLETITTIAVNAKLAIIFALIIMFSLFNSELIINQTWQTHLITDVQLWSIIKKALGLLIIVQGFETSRYIGETHKYDIRIKTMKRAQLISGIIYVIFVLLTLSIFHNLTSINETAVIGLSRVVSPLLPALLIIAALMSQFSAAISDTIGGGGLFAETFPNKITTNTSYLLIALFSLSLIWLTNIYQIISIASKGFAVYYILQIISSIVYMVQNNNKNIFKYILYSILIIILTAVLLIGSSIK